MREKDYSEECVKRPTILESGEFVLGEYFLGRELLS